jgi:hypothetical protein
VGYNAQASRLKSLSYEVFLMAESKRQLAWNLFVEARKEILEYQKIRTQIIGFKITFVSGGIGIIAANQRIDLLVIPAFAAIFFDLVVTSYSFAIKRTGYYCRSYIKPAIRGLYDWPGDCPLWEEFMDMPKAKPGLAQKGNLGITILASIPAI